DEGGSAPVDSVLAIIGPAGTDVSAVLNGAAAPAAAATPVAPKEVVEVKSEALAAAPAAATPAAQAAEVTPSNTRIFASPLAKKLAKEKGLDLSTVKGSGEHGRIIRRDVEQAQVVAAPAASAKAQPAAAPVVVASGVENKESVKNSQMRKVIAKRLSESKFTAPHYYLTVEVEMDEAKAARQQINQLPDTKVSFNDMVLKASAMALLKHKQVNTTWSDEATIINHHVHLGVAVAVEDGLVVPVIKHADQLSFTQLGATVKDMAGRARNKKLTP
ncbi:MAG: 2-oxo acid dehydrogenase subunit E2, partial [Flavobacteriaceae bacterium]